MFQIQKMFGPQVRFHFNITSIVNNNVAPQYEREENIRYVTLWIPLILGVKVLHSICNMGTHGLPDVFTLNPQAHMSGRPPMPMLQILTIFDCLRFSTPVDKTTFCSLGIS